MEKMHYVGVKRALDFMLACLLLAITLPLWGVIACALLLTQGRPIFYRQARAGLDGQPFTLLKFRTMRAGAARCPTEAPVRADHADPRVTSLGRLLRRGALDELPQLLNVLRGEMSLVGPRPLPVDDLAHPGWLEDVTPSERARREDWARRRQCVRPGLTGLWQITANPADDFENWIVCDLTYVERVSPGLDLSILLRTPAAVLRGRQVTRETDPASPSTAVPAGPTRHARAARAADRAE